MAGDQAADGPDPLARYRAMRDFDATPEPSGEGPPPDPGNRFVVQRHRATRLHYDVRLELDGVLVSWAVPKGPTLDPSVRRLAVHVEDHPLDYYDFEGVIPGGEYGGGDVIVWDWGTWAPAEDKGDPRDALAGGDLHVDLHGEKLAGRFVFVRPRPKRGGRRGGPNDWLLLHKHDDHAIEGWDPEEYPRSVKSGRTNDEVAADPDAIWSSTHGPGVSDDELAALDDVDPGGVWEVAGGEIALDDPDAEVLPAAGDAATVTRRDIVRHVAVAARRILPYLGDGAVLADHLSRADLPEGMRTVNARRRADGDAPAGEIVVVDRVATLLWLAACSDDGIRHVLGDRGAGAGRTRARDRARWVVIDLDAGDDTTFADVAAVARLLGTALGHQGIDGAPVIGAGPDVQVRVPLGPGPSFDQASQWAHSTIGAVAGALGDLVEGASGGSRTGGVRIDTSATAPGASILAPFAVRHVAGGPVAVPIAWDELDDPDLGPDRWTVADLGDRLDLADPLAAALAADQQLPVLTS
ncbi:MAG: DNA polymerase ligase N-terminal domain-containing protein [Actinomycetota bacterium]|nr:DNA polymerase ligase N-terminal domain-containing protein [Actinomycetota bacterium]